MIKHKHFTIHNQHPSSEYTIYAISIYAIISNDDYILTIQNVNTTNFKSPLTRSFSVYDFVCVVV